MPGHDDKFAWHARHPESSHGRVQAPPQRRRIRLARHVRLPLPMIGRAGSHRCRRNADAFDIIVYSNGIGDDQSFRRPTLTVLGRRVQDAAVSGAAAGPQIGTPRAVQQSQDQGGRETDAEAVGIKIDGSVSRRTWPQ